jgi:glucose-6-phosphate-specific signal transduction histidine kinase
MSSLDDEDYIRQFMAFSIVSGFSWIMAPAKYLYYYLTDINFSQSGVSLLRFASDNLPFTAVITYLFLTLVFALVYGFISGGLFALISGFTREDLAIAAQARSDQRPSNLRIFVWRVALWGYLLGVLIAGVFFAEVLLKWTF